MSPIGYEFTQIWFSSKKKIRTESRGKHFVIEKDGSKEILRVNNFYIPFRNMEKPYVDVDSQLLTICDTTGDKKFECYYRTNTDRRKRMKRTNGRMENSREPIVKLSKELSFFIKEIEERLQKCVRKRELQKQKLQDEHFNKGKDKKTKRQIYGRQSSRYLKNMRIVDQYFDNEFKDIEKEETCGSSLEKKEHKSSMAYEVARESNHMTDFINEKNGDATIYEGALFKVEPKPQNLMLEESTNRVQQDKESNSPVREKQENDNFNSKKPLLLSKATNVHSTGISNGEKSLEDASNTCDDLNCAFVDDDGTFSRLKVKKRRLCKIIDSDNEEDFRSDTSEIDVDVRNKLARRTLHAELCANQMTRNNISNECDSSHSEENSNSPTIILSAKEKSKLPSQKRSDNPYGRDAPCITNFLKEKKRSQVKKEIENMQSSPSTQISVITPPSTSQKDRKSSKLSSHPVCKLVSSSKKASARETDKLIKTPLSEKAALIHKGKNDGKASAISSIFNRGNPVHNPNKNDLKTATNRIMQPCGISNLGNTCYLNASLQFLFSLPTFFDALKLQNNFHVKKGGKLSSAISNIYYNEESRKVQSAIEVKNCIDMLSDKFVGFQQRDAHEFVSDIVDLLDEEMKHPNDGEKVKKNGNNDTSKRGEANGSSRNLIEEEESVSTPTSSTDAAIIPKVEQKEFIDDFFCMKVQVCLTCNSCKYARHQEAIFRHLSLDVDSPEGKENSSLDRALLKFFGKEDVEIKCEKCKEGATATQTMSVVQWPRVLLLHLKRFMTTTKGNEVIFAKNQRSIHYGSSISLTHLFDSSYRSGSSPSSTKVKDYSLRSVVYHIGSTVNFGHYTTDAYRKNKWFRFDDGKVNEIQENEVYCDNGKRDSYMFLYESK